MQDLKVIHDLLLEQKPEEASHVEADCPFCNEQLLENSHERGEVEEFTKEQVEAAVAEATAPLIEQINTFKAEKLTGDVDAAIAEKDSELTQVKADLDSKVLELEAARAEVADVEAYLASVAAEAAEAARIEEAKATRLAAIAEVADFPQEHIDAHADRWAAMDQADFDAMLEGWSLIAQPKTEGDTDGASEESASFSQVRPQETTKTDTKGFLRGILSS